MKGKGNRAKMQNQIRGPHCTHQKSGRQRGGACEYRRQVRLPSFRPLVSLLTPLFQELARLADRVVHSLSVKAGGPALPDTPWKKNARILPDSELRRRGADQMLEKNNQLPTTYEKVQPPADKQE